MLTCLLLSRFLAEGLFARASSSLWFQVVYFLLVELYVVVVLAETGEGLCSPFAFLLVLLLFVASLFCLLLVCSLLLVWLLVVGCFALLVVLDVRQK